MLRDWYHFLRPTLWAYILAIYLLGFLLSTAPVSLTFVAGAAAFILICTASITVNHYFDRETDAANAQQRFPVAQGAISPRLAAGFSAAIMAASLGLAWVFFPQGILLAIAALLMVVAYSAPPVRIKERPFLETLWNGIGYGTLPYYLALAIFHVPATLQIHLLGFVPFLIAASGHILLQVRDIAADKVAGVTTTSTRLGQRRMLHLSKGMVGLAGLIIIGLTVSGFLSPLAWVAIASGILIGAAHKSAKADVTRSYPLLRLLYVVGGAAFLLSVA